MCIINSFRYVFVRSEFVITKMRLELFSHGDVVLLVGEGNFTFAVNLRQHNLPIMMVATCFESELKFEKQHENMLYLEDNEVPVYLNVDGTKLHEHKHIREKTYSKVIFNFPHVGGKMAINLNRELLKNTFSSAKKVLEDGGEMFVSLCKGQGGTPADEAKRYDDTWQIVEMAAFGDFILTAVEPFIDENFPDYKSVGYRQDVNFNMTGALVHIFRKTVPLATEVEDSKTYIRRLEPDTIKTECGSVDAPVLYAELHKMSLIKRSHSPVRYLYKLFLKELQKCIKGDKLMVLTDDDVPLYVDGNKGIKCTVDYEEYRLRSSPTQILDDVLDIWDYNGPELIFFPAVYFRPISGKNFHTEPPAIHQFLLLGTSSGANCYRYLKKLTKIFGVDENIQLIYRPHTIYEYKTALPKETVKEINMIAKTFKAKVGTEWVYVYKDNSQRDEIVCQSYTLQFKDSVVDACMIDADGLAALFFKTKSWRELWSRSCSVEHQVLEEGINRPILKQCQLYPMTYNFDLTVKVRKGELQEDKFYEILWLAVGLIVDHVELIDTFLSEEGYRSYCFSIQYKSIERPLSRKLVLEMHQNVLGKMLCASMNVVVK